MKQDLLKALNQNLKLGTESDVTPNTEEVNSEEFILESDTGSAQSIEDMQEQNADTIITDTENEAQSVESVEELVTAVESFHNQNKTLSRLESIALTRAFSAAIKNHVKNPLEHLPARESSQSMNFADLALARESMMETAKQIGGDFVAKVKEIIKKVIATINGYVNRYAKLEQRVQALLTNAKNKGGNGQGVDVPVNNNILGGANGFDINEVKTLLGTLPMLAQAVPATTPHIAIEDEGSNWRASITAASESLLTNVAGKFGEIKEVGTAKNVNLLGNYKFGIMQVLEGAGNSNDKEGDKGQAKLMMPVIGKVNGEGDKGESTAQIDSAEVVTLCGDCIKTLKELGVISKMNMRAQAKAFVAPKEDYMGIIGPVGFQARYVSALCDYSFDVITALVEFMEESLKGW